MLQIGAFRKALPNSADDVPIRAFICGCGHSGNTLAAAIVAAHADAHVPPYETGAFLRGRAKARRAYEPLLREARAASKRALIEKTPRHVQKLALIRELVPGARFVMPVRDGRDVTASLARRFGSVERGTTRWIRDNRIVLQERHQPDVFVFRYEDLIETPARIVEALCRFLDLEYSPELLQYHRAPRLWHHQPDIRKGDGRDGPEHDALRNWQVNQPLFDGRGRWRSELRSEELRELTEGAGRPLMEAFGYLS